MAADLPGNPMSLLQQIAGGDREAFGHFYDRYAALTFTFAVRLLGSQAEAEDLLQEVFWQVWRQAGSYDPARGSPEAWLITMTRSRAIDKLRSLRRRDMGGVSLDDTAGLEVGMRHESPPPTAEDRLTIHSVLGKLPPAQRTVLELAYFDGMTQSEIAAQLGEPLGTIKTRMRAGLERLRNFLGTEPTGRSG